jgi:hypothetical protein
MIQGYDYYLFPLRCFDPFGKNVGKGEGNYESYVSVVLFPKHIMKLNSTTSNSSL